MRNGFAIGRGRHRLGIAVLVLAFVGVLAGAAAGQEAAGGAAGAAGAPEADARIDLTGNWVSVVTEDWQWRMVVPAKGDYASMPLTTEGRRVADLWNPAADQASGNQCKAYGVAGIMRLPTRLRVG